MRILYGAVGEGLGHATRSSVVAEHLIAQGHEVKMAASGRALPYLREHLPDVRGDLGPRSCSSTARWSRGRR